MVWSSDASPRISANPFETAVWTEARAFQDLLDGVAAGIDRFRLPVFVQAKHLWGDRLAHRVADAGGVVYPDAQLASHSRPPIAR